ncbi:LysR substrate-binding domain-containing protein [Kiloniella sp. b19]|uniref:LysR substrate-binding domain-containing protein n=1 Tax=Kiloniella sp. GXU_MW_B19 TaxID=3141326 RepID=UPI0031D4917B
MRKLPPLRLLSVFETVHLAGSVKEAAKQLNVSQPAVSQSLRQLEEHVGTALYDRSTRPARLTRAGEILQRAVSDNLRRLSEAMNEINRLKQRSRQTVTLSCTIGVATYWLMPRLPDFYRLYPDITVNVVTTQETLPLLGSSMDIALRFGRGNWDDGLSYFLFREEVQPVCAPALAEEIGYGKKGLEHVPLIHVDYDDPNWVNWSDYLRYSSLENLIDNKAIVFTNYVQARQTVVSGAGIMLGWESITGGAVSNGMLVKLDLPVIHAGSDYYVTVNPASADAPEVKAALDWLFSQKAGQF